MKKIIFILLLVCYTVSYSSKIPYYLSTNKFGFITYVYDCSDMDKVEKYIKNKYKYVRSKNQNIKDGIVFALSEHHDVASAPHMLLIKDDSNTTILSYFSNIDSLNNAGFNRKK